MIVLTGVQVEKSHIEIVYKMVETIIDPPLLMDGGKSADERCCEAALFLFSGKLEDIEGL